MRGTREDLARREFLRLVGTGAGATSLIAPATAGGWGQVPAAEKLHPEIGTEPKLTVVTVTSHCDWTWGFSRAWHEYLYANLIREYLLIMRDHPNYVWQAETPTNQLSPFFRMAAEKWPVLIDEFWRRVKEGRIELGMAYNNPRISEVYPEIFVRNMVVGKGYFRRHAPGVQQRVYNGADLMSGHSQMPQLLAQADYRYFLFTRPNNKQHLTFYRKGLDGTRLLYSKTVYGGEDPTKPKLNYGKVFHGIQPLPVTRISIGRDDALPSREVAKLAETWNPEKMVLSTLRRFFEECEKYSQHITEREGPLDSLSYFNASGLFGNNNIYTHCNQSEDALLSAEKAEVMAVMFGRTFFVDESMDRIWEELLSCIDHGIEWNFRDDYEERKSKVQNARARARRYLEEAVNDVGIGVPHDWDKHTPLMVFNFHEWPMTGPVEFKVDGGKKGAQGLVLRDDKGQEIPLQFGGNDPQGAARLAFVAREVPAFGYRSLYLDRVREGGGSLKPTSETGCKAIENAHFRIETGADGRLKIFDKARGKTLGAPETGGLGDLVVYDMPEAGGWAPTGPPGKRRDWQVESGSCRSVQGPVFSALHIGGRVEGPDGAHRIAREVRLWGDSRRIEYEIGIDANNDNGIFCIRFALGAAGNVTAGIPFGAESRDNVAKELFRTDLDEWAGGGFQEGYEATRWTDVSDADYGYTFVCPPGMHTGYLFRKNEKSLEFILLRMRPMPTDHFRECHSSLQGVGRHSWRCALVPHEGTWREALSYRHAMEQHVPLLAHSPIYGLDSGGAANRRPQRFHPPAGFFGIAEPEWYRNPPPPLPSQASLVEVMPPNVVLSSMRLVKPGGRGKPEYELRLYETTGKSTDAIIRLGRPVGSVRETNFLGEPSTAAGRITTNGREIRFRLAPWKIVTLRIGGGS